MVTRRTGLRTVWRIVAYAWASPWSLVGMVFGLAFIASGGSARAHGGVLEFGGGALGRLAGRLRPPFCFCAITLGHTVVGVDHGTLADVREHEHVHVRQYERWGPFFVPAYLLSSLVQWLLGRRPYLDNRFEREAYGQAGK